MTKERLMQIQELVNERNIFPNRMYIFREDINDEEQELITEIEKLQRELERKDNNWNELKVYSQMNINATCNMNNDNYTEGRYKAYCDILDKIKDIENGK